MDLTFMMESSKIKLYRESERMKNEKRNYHQ